MSVLLDPDSHSQCGYGFGQQNQCGSMRIQIHNTDLLTQKDDGGGVGVVKNKNRNQSILHPFNSLGTLQKIEAYIRTVWITLWKTTNNSWVRMSVNNWFWDVWAKKFWLKRLHLLLSTLRNVILLIFHYTRGCVGMYDYGEGDCSSVLFKLRFTYSVFVGWVPWSTNQCCGSRFIESGSGYVSSISSKSGSGSNPDPGFWWT